MTDSYGDGWDGAKLVITNQAGVVVEENTGSPKGVSSSEFDLTLASPCHNITITTGAYPSEQGFVFQDITVGNNGGGKSWSVQSCGREVKQLPHAACDASFQCGCTACALGQYQTGFAATACTPCPAGSTTNAVGSTAAGDCSPCVAGKIAGVVPGTCDDCSAGKYQDGVGQSECKQCPTADGAASTSAVGSRTALSDCTACAAGKYFEGASTGVCLDCALAKYNSATGQLACMQCATGMSSAAGSTDIAGCSTCAAGKFTSGNSWTMQKDRAEFQPAYAQCGLVTRAVDASAGIFAPEVCVQDVNATGHASSYQASSECSFSFSGQATLTRVEFNIEMQSACNYDDLTVVTGPAAYAGNKYCGNPANTGFPEQMTVDGSASFTFTADDGVQDTGFMLCAPAGNERCLECPLGKYQPNPGSPACILVGIGSTTNGTGATEAMVCPAGKFGDATGACTDCPVGKFQSGPASNICIQCPTGHTSGATSDAMSDCTACEAGKYYEGDATGLCIDCLQATYTDTPAQTACSACPSGFSTASTGTATETACFACPAGKYSNNIGSCTKCSWRKYQDVNSRPACKNCPAGKTTLALGSTSTTACTYDFIPTDDSTCMGGMTAECSAKRWNYWRAGIGTQFIRARAPQYPCHSPELTMCRHRNASLTAGASNQALGANPIFRERAGGAGATTTTADSYGGTSGDFNGDGRLDLFVANKIGPNYFYLGDASGNLVAQTSGPGAASTTAASSNAIAADLNNDGWLDLLVVNGAGEANYMYLNNKVAGVGNQLWQVTTGPGAVGSTMDSYDAVAADWNSDGWLDVVVTNTDGPNYYYLSNTTSGLYEAQSTGPGDASTSRQSKVAVAGDWNSDGHIDLFVGNSGGALDDYYHGDGMGGFTAQTGADGPGHSLSTNTDTRVAVSGDWNGDGRDDLLVNGYGTPGTAGGLNYRPSAMYYSTVAGGLANEESVSAMLTMTYARSAVCGDFDGDGHMDLFVADFGTTNWLFYNNGKGGFEASTEGPGAMSTSKASSQYTLAGDFDNDGHLDIFVMNVIDNTRTIDRIVYNYMYYNTGSAKTMAQQTDGAGGLNGQMISITPVAGDFNGDGKRWESTRRPCKTHPHLYPHLHPHLHLHPHPHQRRNAMLVACWLRL
jgi:hypothetical protein